MKRGEFMIKRIIGIISIIIIMSQSIVIASAVYTTETIDKYTIRVTVNEKQATVGKGIEVTSYSASYSDKTIKIFYKESDNTNKNTIDIDTRSFVGPIRVVLYNVEQSEDTPFTDIKGIESELYIRHLHDMGLLNGDGDGNFRPGSTITRAEFFAMMVRALGYELVEEGETLFTDIDGHWGKKEILTAIKYGLVKGNGDGTIKPNDKVTIGQVALIIDRAYRIKTYGQDKIYTKLPLNDHYAKESVKKMLDAGVLSTEDSTYNNFNIDRPATRAECAMMISRAMVN